MSSDDNQPIDWQTVDTRTLNDEQMIEWAKNFKQKSITVRSHLAISRTGKKRAKKIVQLNNLRAKAYRDPVKRELSWGDNFNRRNRFLYQHNEDFRNLKKYRTAFAAYNKKYKKTDTYAYNYYLKYSKRLHNYAQTFKVDGDNFVLGFTVKELVKYSPFNVKLLKKYLDSGMIPDPQYEGYLFKEKKIETKTQKFYLVQEIEAYMNIFTQYRAKYRTISTDEQKAFLKKKLWLKLLKIRKDFDEAN